MTKDPVEIELKFRVPPDAVEALLQHPLLQGPEQSVHLRSVYFDTPDRELRRCGLGLRVRKSGDGFIQTVKQDNDGTGVRRGEWETPAASEAIDPDALARTPAGAVLDGRIATLQPVFATTVDRRMRMRRQSGSLIEVSLDTGEVSSGERRQPLCELELELKAGEPAALFDLGRALVRDTAVRLSFQGKAERGHRLADEASVAPRMAVGVALDADAGAGAAFQRIAMSCLAQVVGNAEVLELARRPEAIHQMRVGLRRLRAAIVACRGMLADGQHAGVEVELKWLAGELDAARDLDVFIQGVFRPEALEKHDPELAALGRKLLKAQTKAYDHALKVVQGRRYAVAMLETAAWIEAGAWTRSDDPILASHRDQPVGAFAAAALDRLRKAVRRRARIYEQLDPIGRHKLRIRAKRLRYAAEFFAPLFPDADKRKRRFLQRLKRLQDSLGALNDITVAREKVLGRARLDKADLAFAAGRLIGRRERVQRRLLLDAADAVEAFQGAAPFWNSP